jgi:hypothetical protein
MTSRVKGSLLLLAAFGLGVGAGALGFGVYQARTGWGRPPQDPARFQQHILQRLTKELGLRPEQQKSVEAILSETGQEFTRLREEIGPRFRDIRTRTRERIRGVLDAEQQTKFEAVEREWERRAARWHDRQPGNERKAP